MVIKVDKDLIGPNIAPNSPSNKSVHRGPVNVSVVVNDPEGNIPNAGDVIATIYNGTMIPFNLSLTNTGSNQWDGVWSNISSKYYPGYYYINFTVYDSSYYRNINQSVWFLNITYEYDTTAPIIDFIGISDNNTVITTSSPTFTVNIIDENQPQFGDVLFEVSNTSSPFNDTMTYFGGGNWEYIWDNISSYSNGKYLIRAFAIDSAPDAAPGSHSNWSLTWEIAINIVDDDVGDGSDGGGSGGSGGSAPGQFNILTFLTSTTGGIIGIVGALIVAVIVVIKKRGSYKPSNKDKRRIDEYREVFK